VKRSTGTGRDKPFYEWSKQLEVPLGPIWRVAGTAARDTDIWITWNPVPLDRIGQNGTYQYVPVQHGTVTGQYENSSSVQGCMYQYIPAQAFNKTCGFPTNPERVLKKESV
jgi:hypothetical protein